MELPTINLPILDWLLQFFAKLGLVGSILVPAGITAAGLALYFAVSGMKTTRNLEKTKPIQETADTEGMELEGLTEEQREALRAMAERRRLKTTPTLKEGNGHADLEDRLIGALAAAPWEVKEGSEIALEKGENKKWGIATKRIAFVLGRNGEANPVGSNPTPPIAPQEEQAPAPMEESEEVEEAIQ